VLAAGEGRRNRPLTSARPKVMLPVANRPILEHVLASLHAAEVHDVTIVVGYQAESIQTHVQDGERFGVQVRYARQTKPAGSVDSFARGLAASRASDDVLLVPGDNYLGRDVLRRFLAAAGDRDALLYTRSDDPRRYGVIELNDDFVASVTEKPASPRAPTISTGIAKLSARRAQVVKKHLARPETGLTDLLDELARSKERLVGVPLEGPWFDVDRPENLLGANALALAEEPGGIQGVIEPGASVVGPVRIGRGSRIRSGSYLVGPLVVGEGCEIGPHTVVYGPTAVGDNVTIGPFTELLECVVMNDVRIASGCTLHHAVLDRGVTLAPRVHIDRAHGQAGADFGAVVGDGSLLGNQVSLLPGSILGANVRVAPHKIVGSLGDGARVV
jgi:UDP-N-acetylglucosamine diphosphorylase / glucose-1-phosphate thymidylyltransferase / UDP-N-acetylgalactosamine diphosphorylase / glucosamine-1-phosphate N-acetyltransferase / galactosamine-1-phosphate N-acetyltransferase